MEGAVRMKAGIRQASVLRLWRLIRVYGRTEDMVFPTADVNLPVPIEEENNPNLYGCLGRNP
jgi:hypothetical protein